MPDRAGHSGALPEASHGPLSEVAFRDAVLSGEDPRIVCERAADWLWRRMGVRRVVVALVDESGRALRGVAGRGVSRDHVAALTVDVDDRDSPLALALAHRAAALVPWPPGDRAGRRGPLLGAIPLAADDDGGPALGLLLADRPGGSHEAGVRSVCRALGGRLAVLRHGALRAALDRAAVRVGLLEDAVDAVPDAVLVTDTAGATVVANARASELLVDGQGAPHSRRRAAALNNMLVSAALAGGPGSQVRQLTLLDPSTGGDMVAELASAPLARRPDLTVSVLRDVTDLRRATLVVEENFRLLQAAEAETRAERDRLDLVIQAVADPVLVTGPSGGIVLVNPPGERLFAPDPPVDDDAARRVQANVAALSSFLSGLHASDASRASGEMGVVDPATAEPAPVLATSSKVTSPAGELTAVVTILHDRRDAVERQRLYDQAVRHSEELRDRVRDATSELVRQNERLRRQAFELEQALAAKTQFLANMSHELRTPLNAILGYTQLLLGGFGGEMHPPHHKRLLRIDSNARHLLGIINTLLDLARIEAGKMPVRFERVEVGELVHEVVGELEPVIQSTRLRIERAVPADLPRPRTDRQKLKQILVNLLANAFKFTSEGSVRIWARADEKRRALTLGVTDTGVGIAPEAQRRIFEDFFQADASYTRDRSGAGLGLTISRRLAKALGGEISLESELGKGSTFAVTIPLRARPA